MMLEAVSARQVRVETQSQLVAVAALKMWLMAALVSLVAHKTGGVLELPGATFGRALILFGSCFVFYTLTLFAFLLFFDWLGFS